MNKKLIEVSLPLDVINDASAYDKMPGIGPHPKGIHHWWARLPLPAARAVLFASLVDDPASDPAFADKTEKEQEHERERLFNILRALCQKKMYQHPEAFTTASAEIRRSCGEALPIVVDPFCGGGSIPLEAQRLGLEAHGSDLNPVAVLITRAALEIVPRYAGCPPVHSDFRQNALQSRGWTGAAGLAEDVRRYGAWIKEEAEQRIGHLYPNVDLPSAYGGGKASVIAWIWARTMKCPNPGCGAEMPLVSNFALTAKSEKATQTGQKNFWIVPIVSPTDKSLSFKVETGDGSVPKPTKVGRQRASFRCLVCDQVAPNRDIREAGRAKQIGAQLMAIVAEGRRGRVYLTPTAEQEAAARHPRAGWEPTTSLPERGLGFRVQPYGITGHAEMFTNRKITALSTFSDLVAVAREKVRQDYLETHGNSPAARNGAAEAYADAVTTFLAFAVDRCTDFNNALCRWVPSNEKVMNLFGRSAIPMVWDYAEANSIGDTVGSWITCCEYVADCVKVISVGTPAPSHARQLDAARASFGTQKIVVSTDPPYYDSIGYADLSDFFYVWLRHNIGQAYPDLFGTMLTPKAEELIADDQRYDGAVGAKRHFEEGFRKVFCNLNSQIDPRFPMTVYYAFKQKDEEASDDEDEETGSGAVSGASGWETLLEALVSSGFQITGTWPVRASQKWRMRAMGSNALASYIVLVCRPRAEDAPSASKRQFITALRAELEDALLMMMHGSIPPVDLAQASIGPGMSVYSRYSKVEETGGAPVSVRAAMQIINQELNSILGGFDDNFDADTRFCLNWFELKGMEAGSYGDALSIATSKGTTPERVRTAGCIEARANQVRLLRRDELPDDWNPQKDAHRPVWECTQHLVRALQKNGEESAARLCAQLGSQAELARDLAYRLHSICERQGWAQEALAYNSLVIAWPEITKLAANPNTTAPQTGLF